MVDPFKEKLYKKEKKGFLGLFDDFLWKYS